MYLRPDVVCIPLLQIRHVSMFIPAPSKVIFPDIFIRPPPMSTEEGVGPLQKTGYTDEGSGSPCTSHESIQKTDRGAAPSVVRQFVKTQLS
mmetsp:Transcript_21138/g.42327  ORF Transcript_21138/g.42327 Transcript_21138/m.42327 type:complete len:91 (+) Transcript_21138:434-706(+)